jgi:2-phospho-L-lactate guanylyltransferase
MSPRSSVFGTVQSAVSGRRRVHVFSHSVRRLDVVHWSVVIPAKALPAAKSRLAPMSSDPAAHRRLVEAIRADTIAAATAARGVARVLVVVDRADGAPDVLLQRLPGLDAAVREGAAHAAQLWPEDGVAALVGDLPALRPDELAQALRAAARLGSAFVPDASGTGTTLLAAVPGHALDPAFGPGSAQRHAGGATAVLAGPGLRHDVDTAADLFSAAGLGLGTATRAVLADAGITVRSTCSGMMGA